jgi:Holliday junction resolvasome RuvABC DNA-binding subunit
MNALLPVEKASAQAYVEAYCRGEISQDSLRENMHELGLSDFVIDIMTKLRDPLQAVGANQALLNRGEITPEEAKRRFKIQGYSDQEANELIKLAKYIPTVPDFIRMAVREVFTPEVAEKYGQFQDYPAELDKYAAMAGLDPAFAKFYWAAHWELPSISMGFDMFHRGIITYEELKTLLRTLDVMPYWREKMIKLSETPFTRIDVRRMYKAGVLTREEVTRAYMDLGYNEDKASKLTDFVCADSIQDTRDLTKSELLTLYKEGSIKKDEIIAELQTLGYSEDEVNLLVSIVDFQKGKEKLNVLKSAMKASYFAGLVDRNDVLAFIEKQGLPASEVQELLDLWDAEREVRVTLPSRTDLTRFLKKGIIDEETFKSLMAGIGYPDQVIDWYIQDLAEVKK